MKKRGLNDIIATLLIILLSFASIAVIWIVAKAFIVESTESITTDEFTNSFTIPGDGVAIDPDLGYASIIVKRESGNSEVKEINVILRDESGAEKNYPQAITGKFGTYESRKFEVSFLGSSIKKLKSISLAPTIKTPDGKEKRGTAYSAYDVKGNEKPAGRVLWLDFEGSSIIDKSKSGNTVINNGVEIKSDSTRASFGDFVSKDYITVKDNALLNFGINSFSVAFWVKTSSQSKILDKMYGNKGYFILLKDLLDYRLSPNIADGANGMGNLLYNINSNKDKWAHFVVIFDRNNGKVNTYVNKVKSTPLTSGTDNIPDGMQSIDSTGDLIIGRNTADIDNGLIGQLDNLMIFNRALTQDEVNVLYALT